MSRILAIDYGAKRCGLAVTDPMKIIATALETVPTKELLLYLQTYAKAEGIEAFVVGMPLELSGEKGAFAQAVDRFIEKLGKAFPGKRVVAVDERFTSSLASQSLVDSGLKKKARRDKAAVDTASAVLILQTYMQTIQG